MATSSGAPANPTTNAQSTAPQKDKRLFYLLGVGGVLAVLVGGRFVLGAFSGGSSSSTPPTTTNSVTTPAFSPPPGLGAGMPGGLTTAPANPSGVAVSTSATGTGSTNPASLLPLSPYRRDPFQPFVVLPPPPTPVPPPPPAPTPTPAPVPLPPPTDVPLPGSGDGTGGDVPSAPPGFGVPRPGAVNSIDLPLNLPTVIIPRLNARNTTPADAFPPPRSTSGGGAGVTSPAFNKRLSGVVIGNGVRAVLEINDGATPKSYVVQPGDVVEGITVLSISRFNEGGNQVTRMLIRENGGERYVDLKPGPPRNQAGTPGAPGAPGGNFPGGGNF